MLTETKAATQSAKIYGLMAEFDTPEPLLEAARRTPRREATVISDAYSPMPVEGLAEAIGFRYKLGATESYLSPASWEPRAASCCAGG